MTNVIKLQAPFEKLKWYGDCGDVNLRRAIILQAVIDATNIATDKNSVRQTEEAKDWIFGRGAYFVKVCEEAELNPDFVIQVAKEMIEIQYARRGLASTFTENTIYS